MKYLIFLSSLFLSFGLSAASCKPDQTKIKACNEFVSNVLKKAFFEEPVQKNETFLRFVINESEALNFLKAYDPEKLALKENQCIADSRRADCEKIFKPGIDDACPQDFAVLNFFRSLIKGMKKNNWTPATIQLAESVLKKHVSYMMNARPNLLETLITLTIVMEAQEQGFLTSYKTARNIYQEGSQKSSELSKKYKDLAGPVTCELAARAYKEELDFCEELVKRWKAENPS
jgi:hypothetical protein